MQNAEKAFIKLLKAAISDEYVKSLGTMFLNQPQRTFQEFFNQCWEKWGSVTAPDMKKNMEQMCAPWDPNQRYFSTILHQIRDAAMFAQMCDKPIQVHQMITEGETIILDTGLFASQYEQ